MASVTVPRGYEWKATPKGSGHGCVVTSVEWLRSLSITVEPGVAGVGSTVSGWQCIRGWRMIVEDGLIGETGNITSQEAVFHQNLPCRT